MLTLNNKKYAIKVSLKELSLEKETTASSLNIYNGYTAYINNIKTNGNNNKETNFSLKNSNVQPSDIISSHYGFNENGNIIGNYNNISYDAITTKSPTDIIKSKSVYRIIGVWNAVQLKKQTINTGLEGNGNLKFFNKNRNKKITNYKTYNKHIQIIDTSISNSAATPDKILQGYVAYVNGKQIFGEIPFIKDKTIPVKLLTGNKSGIALPSGYYHNVLITPPVIYPSITVKDSHTGTINATLSTLTTTSATFIFRFTDFVSTLATSIYQKTSYAGTDLNAIQVNLKKMMNVNMPKPHIGIAYFQLSFRYGGFNIRTNYRFEITLLNGSTSTTLNLYDNIEFKIIFYLNGIRYFQQYGISFGVTGFHITMVRHPIWEERFLSTTKI